MTQINENIKLADAKIFFPRTKDIFLRYGIAADDLNSLTLRKACELYNVNIDELLSDLRECEERLLLNDKDIVRH